MSQTAPDSPSVIILPPFQPTLIIMAAGIGSRYGGLKQVDPIGPHGEILIDYSIYDALRAGFNKVVFLIRRDIEELFRERIGHKVEQHVETAYVYQELANLPPGFSVPEGRLKPWGTGHAVLCCRPVVSAPFIAINADDYYGPTAYRSLAAYLQSAGTDEFCMAGYILGNTLSEHGSVARGVCETTPDGFLAGIRERTRIEQHGAGAAYTEDGQSWVNLPANTTVSMNFWGFTPAFFDELAARFPQFLRRNAANLLKAEFYLPEVVNALLQEGKVTVKVLPTGDKWLGITYPEDRASVQQSIHSLAKQGLYPADLWAEKGVR